MFWFGMAALDSAPAVFVETGEGRHRATETLLD
jgi:hypothetical protein